jgi:hypothetical protein
MSYSTLELPIAFSFCHFVLGLSMWCIIVTRKSEEIRIVTVWCEGHNLSRFSSSKALEALNAPARPQLRMLAKTRYVINASRDMHIIINTLSIS